MNFLERGPKRWTCPSDRELTLRAKLQTGWSSRAAADADADAGASRPEIGEAEQAAIARVLERAGRVEALELERVRKLNERLDKIKRQACGSGRRNCILCNDVPKFFSGKFYTCHDCHCAVCQKCCIDTRELNSGEDIWLCKICSESREVAKKTNIWTQLAASGGGGGGGGANLMAKKGL